MSKQSLVSGGAKGILGLCMVAAIGACTKTDIPTQQERESLTPYIHLNNVPETQIPILDDNGHETGFAKITERKRYLAVIAQDGHIEAMTRIPNSVKKIIPGTNEAIIDCLEAETGSKIVLDRKIEFCAQRPDVRVSTPGASTPNATTN